MIVSSSNYSIPPTPKCLEPPLLKGPHPLTTASHDRSVFYYPLSLLSISMGVKGLTAQGAPPLLPKWLFFTKVAIILLSVIVLGLAACAISIHGGYSYYYSSGVPGFLIFLVSTCPYGTA